MRVGRSRIRARVKSDLSITFSDERISAHGSLELVRRYFVAIDLPGRLRARFRNTALDGDFGAVRMTMLLIGLLVIGGLRVTHLAFVGRIRCYCASRGSTLCRPTARWCAGSKPSRRRCSSAWGRAGRLARHPSFAQTFALTAALTGALALGAGPAGAGVPDVMVRVLTYNVAGLPLGLSGSHPEVNSALISPRLNDFDLVVVQEDFGFHDDLTSAIDHPYVTEKDTRDTPFVIQLAMDAGIDPPGLGDGLNTFSRSPFLDFTRITWNDCFGELDNGSDCLAFKGFSFARHEFAPGVFVDVYNLHSDAGGDDGSLAARRANLRQLADYIVANSAGEALIVLGDTNSRYTRQGDILPEFVATLGVTDVWIELVRAGSVPPIGPSLQDCQDFASADCERVDKIFYRSGAEVEITALSHAVPSDWVDSQGEQLSDHEPVVAELEVSFVPEPGASALATAALGALGALAHRRRARSRASQIARFR